MEFRKLSAGFGAESAAFDAPFQEIWDAFFATQVLVFTKTKLAASRLAKQLQKDGVAADAIHGGERRGHTVAHQLRRLR